MQITKCKQKQANNPMQAQANQRSQANANMHLPKTGLAPSKPLQTHQCKQTNANNPI